MMDRFICLRVSIPGVEFQEKSFAGWFKFSNAAIDSRNLKRNIGVLKLDTIQKFNQLF